MGFDLLLALAISSLMRDRLGLRAWRSIHWLAYACWPIALVHGLGTGSDVRSGWLLWIVAGSVAIVLAAVCWRLLHTPALTGRRPRGDAALVLAPLLLALGRVGPAAGGVGRSRGHSGAAPASHDDPSGGLRMSRMLQRETARRSPPAHGPSGVPRLLAGWYDERTPAWLSSHVARYGELPRLDRDRGEAFADELEAAGLHRPGRRRVPHAPQAARRARGQPAARRRGERHGGRAGERGRTASCCRSRRTWCSTAPCSSRAPSAPTRSICASRAARARPPRCSSGRSTSAACSGATACGSAFWSPPARYVAGEETAVVNWLERRPRQPTMTASRVRSSGASARRPTRSRTWRPSRTWR